MPVLGPFVIGVLGPFGIGVAGSEVPTSGISDGVAEAILEGDELVGAVGSAVEGLGGLGKSFEVLGVDSYVILGAVAEIVFAADVDVFGGQAQKGRNGVTDKVAWCRVGDGVDLLAKSVQSVAKRNAQPVALTGCGIRAVTLFFCAWSSSISAFMDLA